MYIMNTDKCTRGAVAHFVYSFPSLCIYHSVPFSSPLSWARTMVQKNETGTLYTHTHTVFIL